MRDTRTAYIELEVSKIRSTPPEVTLSQGLHLQNYMMEMVQARRGHEIKEERYDLFSNLLDANDLEADGATKLSDWELLGMCVATFDMRRSHAVFREHLHISGCWI